MFKSSLVGISLASLALVVSGCGGGGPATYRVTGKVTVGGNAAPGVQVNFVPVDSPTGAVGSGTVREDGTYTLYSLVSDKGAASEGVLPGKYVVVLGPPAPPPEAAYQQVGAPGGAAPEAAAAPFPMEYLSADTSPKTVEVTGAMEVNLEL